MEVDSYEEIRDHVWWRGSDSFCGDGWELNSGGEVSQMTATGKRVLDRRTARKEKEERKAGVSKAASKVGTTKERERKGMRLPRQLTLVRRVGSFPKSWSLEGGARERDLAHEESGTEWVLSQRDGGRQAAGPTRLGGT